jgi:L-ribulose-5-phosphate 3-epimerase
MENLNNRAYSLGLYEKAMPEVSWPEKLRIAKEAGYDFVEISIDASEEKIARVFSPKAERKQLVDWMYELDMPIRTLNASALTKYALGDPDPAVRGRGLEIASHAIGLAADLGVRILMIPGYDVYFKPHSDETERLFEEAIRSLSQKAAVAGVQLAFETMENDFMNTVEKGLRWVNRIGSNYLKLYPDIGNTTNGCLPLGVDPAEDLRRGGSAVTALHLKETKPGIYRETPYGTGHVNFPAAIAAAWSIGVRRFVTEFWYKPDGETPAEVCQRFRALLDAAAL